MRRFKRIMSKIITWTFVLVLFSGCAILGVTLGLSSANVNAGGSVQFTATDVIADITGSVSGTATQNTLNDINITWSTTQEEINSMSSSWRGLIIDFVKETNNVTLTININNKSSERVIDVTVTDNFSISNITTTRKVWTSRVNSFPEITVSPDSTLTLSILMSVADLTKSVDGTWSLAINLTNQSIPANESEYQTLAFTYNDTNKTAEVKANSNNKATGDIVIPAKVMHNGEVYAVTSIGSSAFSYCTNLTSVTFTEGSRLESIGYNAFRSCESLQSITIPASVTSIGDDAFYDCDDLTTVTFEEGSQLESIGSSAFSNCSLLQSINIPEGVTSIGEYAFFFCNNLQYNIYDNAKYLGNKTNPYLWLMNATSTNITSCEINSRCKFIYYQAFSYCSSLQSINIPEGVTSIGEYAFDDCDNLQYNIYDNAKYLGNETNPYLWLMNATSTNITSCEINSRCKFIYYQAFYNCKSLQSINIPASVTSIGSSAFSSCSSLQSINIPASVKSIGERAFYYCTKLTLVTFEECRQLESIGYRAFRSCESLQSITIPAGVTSIGDEAFGYCSSLISITVDKNNSVYTSYENGIYKGTTLIVGCQTTIIKEGTTEIGKYAFMDQTSLTSITIPASVTSIGRSAFSSCYDLTTVTFTEGSQLESIGNNAFSYCSSLQSINIPASVTSIGDFAFRRCRSLTSITVDKNNSVYSSYENGLYKGTTLIAGCQTTIIKEGTTEIYEYAFEYQSNLKSIIIPTSVKSIGDDAFYGCSSLTSVTFANPNGWSVTEDSTTTQLSSTDLANTSTAAKYLRNTYCSYTWTRS